MTDFAHSELVRAIAEVQGWGIHSVLHVPSKEEHDADTAQLETLEHMKVTVECTLKGWILHEDEKHNHFETLDDLLSAVSPAFVMARWNRLSEKLETLKERTWASSPTSQDEDDSEYRSS
ncbi:uncharacterized protein JCM15063_002246 [Sporobolomyces koalae]|uniref:uncharacterized protein n=1 Tax=Sporobolomyces koalae TaxID=500713 RepID=UPI003173A7C7